jgi:hypothetical protein
MHLRGTHCVRSDGKTQINRAQSRWNSGIAVAKDGEEAVCEICCGVVSGSVHATTAKRTLAKSCCATGGAVVTGIVCVADEVSATQQQLARSEAQQGDRSMLHEAGMKRTEAMA